MSLCNVSLEDGEDIEISLDRRFKEAVGEVLTSQSMTDCNTFDAPSTVEPKALDVSLDGESVKLTLPKMSAAVITLK